MYFMIAVHIVAVNASHKKLMRFLYPPWRGALSGRTSNYNSSIAIAFGIEMEFVKESMHD
jgi:hypothetical protein